MDKTNRLIIFNFLLLDEIKVKIQDERKGFIDFFRKVFFSHRESHKSS